MDLSDPQTTNSTGSPPSDTADKSSVITPSKRDIFLSTYRRQNFTFPDSVMHYIAKNPKNSGFCQKMIKICKYFFIKNPILIISDLRYYPSEWNTWDNKNWKNIDINRILCKLWITDSLYIGSKNVNNNSTASLIIPKIYQCNFKFFFLKTEIISLKEFMILCSCVEELLLQRVTVNNDDGSVVLFEKIIEQLPKVKRISCTFPIPSNNTSKNTFKELWKIPHLSNYDDFYLYNIPKDFDIDSFYSYMKKNMNTRVYLEFSDQISEETKTYLEAIVDEMIETENHEYKVPCIYFPGIDQEKFHELHNIFSL